jgi:hypothetical protein
MVGVGFSGRCRVASAASVVPLFIRGNFGRIMNVPIWLLSVLAICIVMLAVGCTSNKAWRTSSIPCNSANPAKDCTNAIIEIAPTYKLGFVEFDDQGWFHDPAQLDQVQTMIRGEMGTNKTDNPAGLLMILFVHGWKNNAACDNTNVILFRNALAGFARAEAQESLLDNRPERKVVGVYGGWRGLSAKMEPFKELSFWERKSTAHKVGGYGAMTQLLVDLEELQKESLKTLKPGAPRTELIFVGHSFGAAAMYSAIGQIIEERFEQALRHDKPLKPMGDQIILLNPAFEASRHWNLNRLATSIKSYPPAQRPVLSIFTSRGDWATHYFFPLGRFFSTLFEKNRPGVPQEAANRDAVGWFTPFVTHDLRYDTNAIAAPGSHTTYNQQTKKHEPHSESRLMESVRNVGAQRKLWRSLEPKGSPFSFDDCRLEPRTSYRAGDPMLVVAVDKQIMKDHDDIGNPVMLNFLREYLQFCRPDAGP